MQFSIIAISALASVVVADTVLTQIGDGQIQAPTTENQPTTETATETSTTTSVSSTETSSKPVTPTSSGNETTFSEFPNAAPKAVIGGGLAAIAGLAALL